MTDSEEIPEDILKEAERVLAGFKVTVSGEPQVTVFDYPQWRLMIAFSLLRERRRHEAQTPPPQSHVACPCTLIEQDEDCPVGYPSLLCGVCEGKGHTTQEQVTALACEMIKIASDIGGPEDPFAAWESIDLIKSQHERMRKALAPFAEVADRFDGVPVSAILPQQCWFTPHSLREARAALATTEGKDNG